MILTVSEALALISMFMMYLFLLLQLLATNGKCHFSIYTTTLIFYSIFLGKELLQFMILTVSEAQLWSQVHGIDVTVVAAFDNRWYLGGLWGQSGNVYTCYSRSLIETSLTTKGKGDWKQKLHSQQIQGINLCENYVTN